MPVSTVTNRVPYQGDGTSAVFAFQYPLQKTSDIAVFTYNSSATAPGLITPMVLNGAGGTGYTVGGNADPSGIYPNGVNIILNSAPNVQAVLVLFRSSIITNTFSVSQTGAIPSSGLNNELDYLTLIAQRFQDQATRSARLHDGLGATFDPTLPQNIAQSPGKFLIVNSNANGLDLSSPLGGSYIANTLLYADASLNVNSLGGSPSGQVLVSNGSSAPSWQLVSLSGSSVSGTLTLTNGGTGGLTPQQWGVVFASSATQLATTDPAPVGLALVSNASSSPKFQKLDLTSAVGSTLATAFGGTGTPGTYNQFGVVFASSTTQFTSTASGGKDQPLVGNAGAAPSFQALNLASGSSVTGLLTLGKGGTGADLSAGVPIGAPIIGNGSSALTFATITGTQDLPFVGNVVSGPSFAALPLNTNSSVTGILRIPFGGTGTGTSYIQYGVVFASSATQFANTANGAAGQVLTANASSAPTWQAVSVTPTAVTNINANYVATTSDKTIFANSSNYTVTLFDATGNTGRDIVLVKTASSALGITIQGSGTQKIAGLASITLDFKDETYRLATDGNNWAVTDWSQPARQIGSNVLLVSSSAATFTAGTTPYFELTKNLDGQWYFNFNMDVAHASLASPLIATGSGVLNYLQTGTFSQAITAYSLSSGQAINFARVNTECVLQASFPGAATRTNMAGKLKLASKPITSL